MDNDKKVWDRDSTIKAFKAIFYPKCMLCSDTGVIAFASFNSEDKDTWDDWAYCKCAEGIRFKLKNSKDSDKENK